MKRNEKLVSLRRQTTIIGSVTSVFGYVLLVLISLAILLSGIAQLLLSCDAANCAINGIQIPQKIVKAFDLTDNTTTEMGTRVTLGFIVIGGFFAIFFVAIPVTDLGKGLRFAANKNDSKGLENWLYVFTPLFVILVAIWGYIEFSIGITAVGVLILPWLIATVGSLYLEMKISAASEIQISMDSRQLVKNSEKDKNRCQELLIPV